MNRWPAALLGLVCFVAGWCLAHWDSPVLAWQKTVKDPVISHGMNLRVRLPNESEFTASSLTYSVEVWRDPNTGNLVYISETGSIAVVPER